jgi:protein-disulfide isomerase
MTSGKQSKRRRREAQQMAIPQRRKRTPQPRAPRPKVAPPGSRRASTKVLLAAAGVVVLVGIAVVLAAVLTRGSDSDSAAVPSVGSLQNALPGAPEVERLFAGIRQQGDSLGRANAPVTLVEYVDMQCPFCREYATQALPVLIRRYVRDGRVRIESRTIAILGPDSVTGQQAVIAAGEQGKAFNLEQLLFFNQGPENTGWLNDDLLTAAAASVPGMRVPELLAARHGASIESEGNAIAEQAGADGVDSTPTILVGKTGGSLQRVDLEHASDVQAISAAIENALP